MVPQIRFPFLGLVVVVASTHAWAGDTVEHAGSARDTKAEVPSMKSGPGPHERDVDREILRKDLCRQLVNLMPKVDADVRQARQSSAKNAKANVGFVLETCRQLAPLVDRVSGSSALEALSSSEFKSIYSGYCEKAFSDYSLSASLGDYRNAVTPTEDDQRLQSFSTALSQVARAEKFSARERASLERLTEALRHPERHFTLRTDELNDRVKRLRAPMEQACDAKGLRSEEQVLQLRDRLTTAAASTTSQKLQRAFASIAQKLN
ncbi:MAG: hypothetical protein JST16_10955, partial [Bdellovibrionales bacterium]|nr:hypothetical protein [Bdellovibrionales bacterium]